MTTLLTDFELALHGVQALRRRVERLSCPLQGATGVRAQFYPHQVQTVREILSSLRIRHLIADEVGMGKTIQALMIMNALRLQRDFRLRTLIVVPHQEAARQWSDEVRTRAHTAHDDDTSEDSVDWVKIRHVAELRGNLTELDAERSDLLVVDEPQSLARPVLERITRQADDYARLLVLTASPNLRSARAKCRLLQLLEPQRVEQARRIGGEGTATAESEDWIRRPIDDLSEAQLQRVDRALRDWQRTVLTAGSDGSGVRESEQIRPAGSRSLYRHITRARRRDFPEHLPQRKQTHLCVEPTFEEAKRFELTTRYLAGYLARRPGHERREQVALIARRAALGGDSWRDRLGSLARDDEDPFDELGAIREISRAETGDSRLDELVDWLTDLWHDEPRRKVVVAAQDNPTIDELKKLLRARIPTAGPRGERIPVEIVCARDERDDPSATMAESHVRSTLAPFQEGTAQLLLAHDTYREIYNLQAADAIVFYGLPWDPVAVDQWIGRVDRLGREVVDPEHAATRPVPVRIVTLVRRGQSDERVKIELVKWGLFDHPLTPNQQESQQIGVAVRDAGLGIPTDNSIFKSSELMDGETDSEDSIHRQLGRLPGEAVALRDEIAFRIPVEPSLRRTPKRGYVSSRTEDSLSRWLRLLAEQKYFGFWRHRDEAMPENRSRVYWTIFQDKRAPIKLSVFPTYPPIIPYFLARANIQRPPRAYVKLKEKTADGETSQERVLQFLDHGSSLHEELVETFLRVGRYIGLSIRLFGLGARHFPADSPLIPGRYLTAVGMVDSASVLVDTDLPALLLNGLSETQRTQRIAAREQAKRTLAAGQEADVRFVRMFLSPRLCIRTAFEKDHSYQTVNEERAKWDLLTPHWTADLKPNFERLDWTIEEKTKCENQLTMRLAEEACDSWRTFLSPFSDAVVDRCRQLRMEADETRTNLEARLVEVRSRIAARVANNAEEDKLQLQLSDRPAEDLLVEQIELVERHCFLRCDALNRVAKFAADPAAASVDLQVLLQIDLRADPNSHEQVALQIAEEEEDGDADTDLVESTKATIAPETP